MDTHCNAIFYVDGLCEPKNPGGVACYGWVGYWKGKKARQGFGVIGEGQGMTNNLAEYTALIEAMKHLQNKGYTGAVEFRGDSQLIVNQMSGEWRINKDHLRQLNRQAQEIAKTFESVSYTWVPREQNEEADALSRKAYYKHTGRQA